MSRFLIRHLVLSLVVLLTTVVPAARAAEVQGSVTDYSDGKPIDGVRVSILEGTTLKWGPVPTLNGGHYEFAGVNVGTYIVRFDWTSATKRPDDHALLIQNSGDAKRVDAVLMK